jgi:hypothetical protein
MTALNPAVNTGLLYQAGTADKVALYALRNVTAGDTVDIGPSGAGQFQGVERAVVIGVDVFVEVAASISGTVITMPSGLSLSDGYLLAWGAST